MVVMKCLLLILCLFFLAALPVFCADFYVSTAGSDSNPGTQAQPLATIQHAVDISPEGPTTYIHLDASQWAETVIILDKDISIAGDYNGPHGMGGKDATHINGGIQSHASNPSMYIPKLLVSNLSSQWIDHMMQTSGPSTGSSVTNCDISNPAGDGIKGWYINASSCIVHNCTGNGLILVRDSNASNCTVYNNNGYGISISSTGYGGDATNNTVYNNNGHGITGSCFPVSINENICHDNAGSGIAMGIGYVEYYPNSISNNHCYDNGSYGISISPYVTGLGNLTIDTNIISGNGNAGLGFGGSFGANNAISNNTIDNNNGYGIQFDYGVSYKVYNNTIINNVDYGIIFPGSSQADLGGGALGSPGNNTISGNGTYEIYNASPNNIYAKNNHWDDQSEGEMAGHFYNTTNVTRIWDKWEDGSKGYIVWSDPAPTRTAAPSLGMIKATFYPSSNTIKQAKAR
jgi:hypothetical protein